MMNRTLKLMIDDNFLKNKDLMINGHAVSFSNNEKTLFSNTNSIIRPIIVALYNFRLVKDEQ